MRAVVWMLVLAGLLWCGYWAVGSVGVSRAVTGWLEDRTNEAWQAEAGVAVAGFPRAFDLTLADVALADPETGLAWEAPEFRVSAPAWAPTQIQAAWPRVQTVASPYERIEVKTSAMWGRLTIAPTGDLTLQQGEFELRDMELASSLGWTAALAYGTLGIRAATTRRCPTISASMRVTSARPNPPGRGSTRPGSSPRHSSAW